MIPISTRTKKQKQPEAEEQQQLWTDGTGFYYGLGEEILQKRDKNNPPDENNQIPGNPPTQSQPQSEEGSNPTTLQKELIQTLSEFRQTAREMRDILSTLRNELDELAQVLKKQLPSRSDEMDDEDGIGDLFLFEDQRRKEYEDIAKDVEEWAQGLFCEGEEDGWKQVCCNNMLHKKYNRHDSINVFLKWLPDSRGTKASDPAKEYPCVKVHATISASMEDVCRYLSNPQHIAEYNDLVVEYSDLEEIAPHSKICYATCPQVLFIKPRSFVTFCHLKWKRDGTQVVVNQAVDDYADGHGDDKNGNCFRASALRGANFISPHPQDKDKTVFYLLAHADPGGDVPPWAMKTAINALAPIEPFKMFYRIEKGIRDMKKNSLSPSSSSIEMVSSSPSCKRPGGLSQLGYACFWPNGGGLREDDKDDAMRDDTAPRDFDNI